MPAPITRKSQEFAKRNFNKQLRGFALARCELAPFAELFEKSFVQGGKDGADMQTVFLTMLMMESFPTVYDAGLALCGPLAPASYFMSRNVFDMRVVFDYFFPGALPSPA